MQSVFNMFFTLWSILCQYPIGTGSSLNVKPSPLASNNQQSLISFKYGSNGDWQQWANQLATFTAPYDDGQQYGANIQQCDWDLPPRKNKVCYFELRLIGANCTKKNNFGYDVGRPCVAITLDKVLDWVPEPYNKTCFPETMPEPLKRMILAADDNKGMIWLSCDGETASDKENIGPLMYTPTPGFPTYYYPYKDLPNYLSPIVMVEFLRATPGVVINVECKAWAHNIRYGRDTPNGRVRFQLMIN